MEAWIGLIVLGVIVGFILPSNTLSDRLTVAVIIGFIFGILGGLIIMIGGGLLVPTRMQRDEYQMEALRTEGDRLIYLEKVVNPPDAATYSYRNPRDNNLIDNTFSASHEYVELDTERASMIVYSERPVAGWMDWFSFDWTLDRNQIVLEIPTGGVDTDFRP
jgi:hypothetical protein